MDVLNHIRIDRFQYTDQDRQRQRYAGQCMLDVYIHPGHTYTAIATELTDNPGISVTNGADGLWTAVVRYLGILPEQLRPIEHYPARGHNGEFAESFDLVVLKWQGFQAQRVTWKHLAREDWPAFFPVLAP